MFPVGGGPVALRGIELAGKECQRLGPLFENSAPRLRGGVGDQMHRLGVTESGEVDKVSPERSDALKSHRRCHEDGQRGHRPGKVGKGEGHFEYRGRNSRR